MKRNRLKKAKAYASLLRPGLSLAVTLSAIAGYFLCYREMQPQFPFMVLAVFLLAGGASILNQYQERLSDALMHRTGKRAIPSGLVNPPAAMTMSVVLIVAGIVILLITAGLVPAILGAVSIVTYIFIYTPLKKRSSLAVIPGALSGAIPPLIGYTAACENPLGLPVVWLSLFMFMWQIPHLRILLTEYHDDYVKGGFGSLIATNNMKKARIRVAVSVSILALILTGGLMIETGLADWVLWTAVLAGWITTALFWYIALQQERFGRMATISLNGLMLMVIALIIANKML